jgi:hypothetical protein
MSEETTNENKSDVMPYIAFIDESHDSDADDPMQSLTPMDNAVETKSWVIILI